MTGNLTDVYALRQVAERYAVAVDRRNVTMFAAQFTKDGWLEAPLGRFEGRDEIGSIIASMAERYEATFHGVLSFIAEIDGHQACAETYCIARHFFSRKAEGTRCYEMTIRYQDEFAIEEGCWRFSSRRLVVDARREFPVEQGSYGKCHGR